MYVNISAGLGQNGPRNDRLTRLREMAKWLDRAHAGWKNLNKVDRTLMVLQMAANYGKDFAKRFLASVGKRNPRDMVEHYYGPGTGPAPATLTAWGYKLAQKDIVHQWWVHPSGERVTRNYLDDQSNSAISPTQPALSRGVICKDIDTLKDSICSSAAKICKIADELNDPPSRDKCEKARVSCEAAQRRSKSC